MSRRFDSSRLVWHKKREKEEEEEKETPFSTTKTLITTLYSPHRYIQTHRCICCICGNMDFRYNKSSTTYNTLFLAAVYFQWRNARKWTQLFITIFIALIAKFWHVNEMEEFGRKFVWLIFETINIKKGKQIYYFRKL